MLIDSFCFGDELLLLDFRLSYLNPIVDRFILVESTLTQSGQAKPLYFEDNKHKFKKYLDKIIHVKITEHPHVDSQWTLENFQRQSIKIGLKGLPMDSLLLLSDLDEVPNRFTIQQNLLNWSISLQNISLNHSLHYYYVNLYAPKRNWFGTIVTNPYSAITNSPQQLRNQKDHMPHIMERGGWHLSYLGGFKTIENKFKNNCEPFNKKDLDFKLLENLYPNAAKDGGYFMSAENPYDQEIKLAKCDLNLLPEELQKKKYESFILK